MSAADPTHFVSSKPFEPNLVEQLTPSQERYYKASQTRLMWWKFRANRLALLRGVAATMNRVADISKLAQ